MMYSNTVLLILCLPIVYICHAVTKLMLITPYIAQRRFKQQHIPGHYIPIVGDMFKVIKAMKHGIPADYNNMMFDQYGDYYYSSFGPSVHFATCDPSILNYILNKNVKSYHKSELMKTSIGELIGTENIFLTESQLHAIHRKAISPVFHYNNLKSMHSNMYDTVMDVCKQWNTSIDNSRNQSTELIMHKQLSSLTLDIISANVFGMHSKQHKQIKQRVCTVLETALNAMTQRITNMTAIMPGIKDLPLPNKRIITQSRTELQNIINEIIADKKAGHISSAQNHDLLDLLLSAEIDDKITGKPFQFSDPEIFGNAMTFVVAGHESTSNLLTWTFACLLQNPDCLRTLQHELDTVLKGQPPMGDKLQQLQYTEYVLMETLRTHTPADTVMRTAAEDNVVVASDGKRITIHKGCDIFLNLQRLHFDPKYWTEPHKFDPTRFGDYSTNSDKTESTAKDNTDGLDAQVDTLTTTYTSKRKRIAPYTFLPFSAGTRSCIGQNFALLEAKIILATILQQFNMELVPGQKIEAVLDVTVRVKGGLKVILTKRPEYHQ